MLLTISSIICLNLCQCEQAVEKARMSTTFSVTNNQTFDNFSWKYLEVNINTPQSAWFQSRCEKKNVPWLGISIRWSNRESLTSYDVSQNPPELHHNVHSIPLLINQEKQMTWITKRQNIHARPIIKFVKCSRIIKTSKIVCQQNCVSLCHTVFWKKHF